ncbi:MAG: flp protein [Monoraphidium minutum]|nr:MAG: flp protein [Monoraphidium minutum]
MAQTRDMLANQTVVAKFKGLEHRPCMFKTSMCPDKCNHPTDWGLFDIQGYLEYEKPGEYGDEKSKRFAFDLKGQQGRGGPLAGTQAEYTERVRALAPGDWVRLSWVHEYVHDGGANYPERPVTALTALAADEAEALAAGAAAP